jgi:hypothetical protein
MGMLQLDYSNCFYQTILIEIIDSIVVKNGRLVMQIPGLKILVKNTFADLTLTPRLRWFFVLFLFLSF